MPTTAKFSFNSHVSSSMVTMNEALEADEYKTVDVTGKIMNKKKSDTTSFQEQQTTQKS